MIINDELMDNIVKLSKLNLKISDRTRLSSQLSKILEHMKVLDEIEISSEVPMFHGSHQSCFLREDKAEDHDVEKILKNAPEKQDNYFAVPNIIVEEDV